MSLEIKLYVYTYLFGHVFTLNDGWSMTLTLVYCTILVHWSILCTLYTGPLMTVILTDLVYVQN